MSVSSKMLANLHYALLLASTVFSGCVYAGSWAWQPKVNTSFGSIEITEPLSGTVNGIAADKKLHELSKRYGYPSRLSESRPWPGCTIRYCFVDDNTERVLFLDLKAAIEKWYTSGLSRETFKWEKVDRAKCFRERSNHLVITITQVPSHSTTLGYKPASPRFPGPSMNLYNGELTALDRIAGFAHEVGHAWGLHHEHQLPKYWFSKDGFENANGGDSAVFGIGTFHCQRLADYAERAAHVRDDHKQPETTVQKLCTHYSTAELYSFSAVNWLPEISALMITDAEEGVDWASIMLYPGFLGSGDPNVQILTGPKGKVIGQNMNPSARDIQGLNKFCENAGPPPPPLLLEKSNPIKSLFKSIFGRDNGPKGGC